MRCYDCDGNYIRNTGTLSLSDPLIGDYTIEDIEYDKCANCGQLAFPKATLEAIETKGNEIREKLIIDRPLSEFIGATQAAAILGISRQAIHKHRRIRRGFIYSAEFEGKRVYHKNSVELFKKTGDGRFPLVKQVPIPEEKAYGECPPLPIKKVKHPESRGRQLPYTGNGLGGNYYPER